MGKKTAALREKIQNRPFWVGPLIGWACVLAGSAGLVYFWRVVFSLGSIPAIPFTLLVAGVASVVYALFLFIWRYTKNKFPLRAALCVFAAGLLFVFANAPLQAPDEDSHFLRAYSISRGHFNYDYERDYPGDVDWLFFAFGSPVDGSLSMGHAVQYQNGELAPSNISVYREGLEVGKGGVTPVKEPVMFTLLPFLPSALGMFMARLFGFKALGLLYAGRIANLLLYSAICYKTFKNCDKYRGVFLAIALLPLSLFLAASNSYDSVMLALGYLLVSYFCKKEITSHDVIIFGLALAFITYLKPLNIVLVAVLLLIPKARWKSRFNPWACVGIMVAVAMLFWYGLGWVDGNLLKINYPADLPRGGGAAADPAGQLAFILSAPFAFIARVLLTLYENAGYLSGLGTFGWTDLAIPIIGFLSVLSLASSSALGIQQKEDTRPGGAVGLFLAAGLYAAAILAGLYVLESDVASIRVTGVQARYFLPAFLLLFMLASILLGKAVRPRLSGGTIARTETITLYIVLAVALLSALLLFQNYFVGQWVPKSDGYKMVNMLGWQVY